ncbi:MAG: hypothetical protein K2Q09_04670 [Phycisphaerales bacterium]|nr:hypothetical protein [Phycisphaerales bacterium]
MLQRGLVCTLGAPVAVGLLALSARGNVVVGSSSNFNDGDQQGWTNGVANDPQVLPGGPGGASDPYLRVTSDGSGPGGKLTVFNNLETWTGRWLTAGITTVEMDLRNFDPQNRTLSIRMGFLASAGPGQGGWSTQAFSLPADGQWHRAVFTISQATMVSVNSPLDWTTAMESVSQLRIFHSVNPSATGVNINSSIGIDNIVALPAPGATVCLGAAGMLGLRRRRV